MQLKFHQKMVDKNKMKSLFIYAEKSYYRSLVSLHPYVADLTILIFLLDASAYFGPGGGSAFDAYPLPSSRLGSSFSVRQQPPILKSMPNTTPPLRPCVGGIIA